MLIAFWCSRRFLRARKFDVEGAWGQFKDTEDWRKDNAIEALYENIGVDSYEAARRMVCFLSTWNVRQRPCIDIFHFSIPSGLAAAIAAVSPSTSLRSATSITRLSPLTTLP